MLLQCAACTSGVVCILTWPVPSLSSQPTMLIAFGSAECRRRVFTAINVPGSASAAPPFSAESCADASTQMHADVSAVIGANGAGGLSHVLGVLACLRRSWSS